MRRTLGLIGEKEFYHLPDQSKNEIKNATIETLHLLISEGWGREVCVRKASDILKLSRRIVSRMFLECEDLRKDLKNRAIEKSKYPRFY